MVERLPPVLVVMALAAESAGQLEQAGVEVLYTGVGKVNAAMRLVERLCAYRLAGLPPPRVVNFGTAGSERIPPGSLVGCHQFIDRDMDATLLGVEAGETPFDPLPALLEFPRFFAQLPAAICGSGDGFAVRHCSNRCEVMDMEAYALAKACRMVGAEFACAKYISDGAGADAAGEWRQRVADPAAEFAGLYRALAVRR